MADRWKYRQTTPFYHELRSKTDFESNEIKKIFEALKFLSIINAVGSLSFIFDRNSDYAPWKYPKTKSWSQDLQDGQDDLIILLFYASKLTLTTCITEDLENSAVLMVEIYVNTDGKSSFNTEFIMTCYALLAWYDHRHSHRFETGW